MGMINHNSLTPHFRIFSHTAPEQMESPTIAIPTGLTVSSVDTNCSLSIAEDYLMEQWKTEEIRDFCADKLRNYCSSSST